MLSSVLNSKIATKINIAVVKAFIEMRRYIANPVHDKSDNDEQMAELRKLLMLYMEKNDKRVNEIIVALNNLIAKPPKAKRIGFTAGE